MTNDANTESTSLQPTLPQRMERLRRDVLAHIDSLGLNGDGGAASFVDPLSVKDRIRAHHAQHRNEAANRERRIYERSSERLLAEFAEGSEVEPSGIEPEIIEVKPDTHDGDLFRMATLLWSVPVSRGYGRRMRFIVRDRQNGKLLGLLAIGSPVFNLHARDSWIGWNSADRSARLTHVMDAYVVGAVPPYSQLIGGKLVAALLASQEIADKFASRYEGRKGLISGEVQSPTLVLVTTTSALGRSSLYNRLKLRGLLEFERIGETSGYGHFQISDSLFSEMRSLLTEVDHRYASGHQFGNGPNWRMRVVRETLELIDLDPNLLRHGIRREVFGLPLAHKWREFLCGSADDPQRRGFAAADIAEAAKERWLIPRGIRRPAYRSWTRADLKAALERRFHSE